MIAHAIQKNIEFIESYEKQIFWAVFSLLISLTLTYGFLVNKTISNAISKERMDSEIATLNTNVNTLEFQYLSLKDSITMNLALSKGFVETKEANFAALSPTKSLSLSLNPR